MQNKHYQPFNDEWRKEVKKMPKSIIENVFGVNGNGFNKNELIEMVRANQIVKTFNENHAIGSKIMWKNTHLSEPKEMTVKCAAFLNYGNPVVFFNEVPYFCSIEPDFVIDL